MEKMLLGDIAQVHMGLTFRRYIKGDAPKKEKIIMYSSLKAYEGILNLQEETLAREFDEKYYAKKGDILIKTVSPNDAVCVIAEEGCVIGDKIAIIRLISNVSPEFMAYLLNSPYIKKQLRRLNDGKLKNVSLNDIRRLEIKIPDIEEQLKYVQILNLIDEKINIAEDLVKASKELRDGLLNNLLGDE